MSPHAFPVVQTLQHVAPEESPHAVVNGPPVAASVRARAAPKRKFLKSERSLSMGTPFVEVSASRDLTCKACDRRLGRFCGTEG